MFLKRGKRPSVVSCFQRPGYCRQASKPTTKDINDCCVLDLGKFPCVFQIIQCSLCPLTHVLPPHETAITIPSFMDTFRQRFAQNCRPFSEEICRLRELRLAVSVDRMEGTGH